MQFTQCVGVCTAVSLSTVRSVARVELGGVLFATDPIRGVGIQADGSRMAEFRAVRALGSVVEREVFCMAACAIADKKLLISQGLKCVPACDR